MGGAGAAEYLDMRMLIDSLADRAGPVRGSCCSKSRGSASHFVLRYAAA